ncbi:Cthe_2314 family HEPN domain-containing protein [Sporohalobacter salinus]|uniref:Cthe_2314 family HEPN domain-containing protein n=1 Tax=Sporohalobacter salinus TaxID=1494606 RepID=UPI0019617F6F|nr:Cthe_2314 family HEPN domain-containing protein [Sporohalobacter salinus]MBM7623696.1 hypothetical protein [Sporohalobacter salinus]
MSINLFDFGGFPTKEERKEISQSIPYFKELRLEVDYNSTNEHDIFSVREFKSWLRQFNNRIGEVKLSYIMAIYYYKMRIPDENWHISPGHIGQSVEYFPDFEEKHFCIKYFFDYYADIFYYKIFGVWDSIYHLINVFYCINIKGFEVEFKGKLMRKLKKHNIELYKYFQGLRENPVYKKANKIRNDLTHNFPSNDVGPGVERSDRGYTVLKVGDYITSKEFKENMDGIIELLWETIKKLEIHFSSE